MIELPDNDQERIEVLSRLCDPRLGEEESRKVNFLIATKLHGAYTYRNAQPFEEEQMERHGKIVVFAETLPLTDEQWTAICDYAVEVSRREIVASVLARRAALDLILKWQLIPADTRVLTRVIENLHTTLSDNIPHVDDEHAGKKVIEEVDGPSNSYKLSEWVFEHGDHFGNLARGVRYEMKPVYNERMDEEMASIFAGTMIESV